jgi:hypothetical protein
MRDSNCLAEAESFSGLSEPVHPGTRPSEARVGGQRDSSCLAEAEGFRGLTETVHPDTNEAKRNEWRGGRDSNPVHRVEVIT